MTLNSSRRQMMKQAAAAGALGLLTQSLPGRAALTRKRPNILFILADDLGYADLSCYGARSYQTPVLDKLARQGARLTQAYANSSVCSATRTALITGRYQYRLPVGLNEPVPEYHIDMGLPPSHPTLPSLLKKAGYTTALVGKWHLGAPPNFGPLKSGYDSFFGFYMGAIDYFRHGENGGSDVNPYPGLHENDTPVHREGYLTDLLADDVVRRIEAHRGDAPFFTSLHFNAPHWPWEGPDDAARAATLTGLRDYEGGNLAKYAEIVQAMDAAIGRILAALERAGLADDTIVVFTSDNGGERFSDMWPFTGQKGELLEGGLRVPAIIRWPGAISPNSVIDQVAMTMDWLPTLVAAAGTSPDTHYPSDGQNLLPQLAGAAPIARRLFWRHHANSQQAMRDGDLKYLKIGDKERLFNLALDQRERSELQNHQRVDFERMKADYAAWNKTMLPYPDKIFSENPTGRQADRY